MARKGDWRESLNLKHPSLKPLWVRILTVTLSGSWSGVELMLGSVFWSAFFCAATVYMAYIFFISPERAYFSTPNEKNTEE